MSTNAEKKVESGRTDPRQLLPLLLILHLLLNFVNTLQGLKALIQQEGCVINQHVDVAHKLLARAESGRGDEIDLAFEQPEI